MHVASDPHALQSLEQLGREIEVGLVDQLTVRFKRIGSICHTIEHGSRGGSLQDVVQVRINQEIRCDNVLVGNPGEAPGRGVKGRANHVVALPEQQVEKVGSNESAGPENQDRALKLPDLRLQFLVCHHCFSSNASMDCGSSPHSFRW